MNMTVKKALSDVRHYPGRFALVVFALVIGIWGVGSILVSYYILSRDLTQNYLNTRPAHAILKARDFDKLDLDALRARPEIEAAEFRDYSMQRIEVSPDRWIPLWLYGVADFRNMHLAQIYRESGTTVPVPGSVLVERNGLRISDFAKSNQVRVRLPQGIKTIPISGISFDPAQAPATQDAFIYAYTDQATFAALTGEPINQRLILRLNNVADKAQVEKAVEHLVQVLATQGVHINKVTIPTFNAHPHQWQLDTLILLQGTLSVLAFIMGAVLVSQLMASILAKQVRQIGVMKAIGASRARVLGIYAVMVLSLGTIAAIVGVPLALASGYGFSHFVAQPLNFNILTTHLPWYIYATIIGVSLSLPLILSLPTLLKGARISVREALSDYGITANPRDAKTVAPWLRRLPITVAMAMRNTSRQKRRLAITLLTMALGVAIFSTGFNVRQSLAAMLQETSDSMRHDIRVVLKRGITRDQATALFGTLANVRKIEDWNGGRGEMQTKVLSSGSGVGIIAVPHGTELMRPRVVQGRWLQGGGRAEAVMNMQGWDAYHSPPVGSLLPFTLDGKKVELTLVGLVEEFDKPKLYVDQQFYNARFNPSKLVNSFMFAAKNKAYDQVMSLKQAIERVLANTDLRVLEVMSHAERVKIIYDHLNIILSVLLFLAFMVLSVSALGMASAMGISIMERTREIGVLRAIGATPAAVFKLFVTEGILTSVVSIVLGLLLSWPLSIAACVFFGDLMLGGANLPFVVSKHGLLITLATTLIFGWLASRIPARSAIKVPARVALSYE